MIRFRTASTSELRPFTVGLARMCLNAKRIQTEPQKKKKPSPQIPLRDTKIFHAHPCQCHALPPRVLARHPCPDRDPPACSPVCSPSKPPGTDLPKAACPVHTPLLEAEGHELVLCNTLSTRSAPLEFPLPYKYRHELKRLRRDFAVDTIVFALSGQLDWEQVQYILPGWDVDR